jgi:hypothetical protein
MRFLGISLPALSLHDIGWTEAPMKITPLFFSIAAFTGCGMTEEKFEEKYADAYCEWMDGCAKVSEQHGTIEDCLKFQKIFADDTLTPDGCTFNPEEAKECLQEIQDNDDCVTEDSIPDECLEVSTCTDTDTGS